MARTSQTFRDWHVEPRWLVPPSLDEFEPEGHPAHVGAGTRAGPGRGDGLLAAIVEGVARLVRDYRSAPEPQ